MVTIARKARQIKYLHASFLVLLGKSIKRREYDYVTLLRGNLILGFGGNERIGIYKSKRYAEMKYGLSKLAGFGNVDLKLTGAFYEGITIRVGEGKFIVFSNDKKSPILEDRYGKTIFVLSDEGHSFFIRIVFKEFKAKAVSAVSAIE